MDRLTLHAERVVLPPVGDRAEPLEITSRSRATTSAC